MKELTEAEQAIIARGAQASEFLNNPAMASAINELSENIANAMLSTRLEESDKRERMYNLHVALRELVATLNQRIAQKETLEAQLVDETENE